MFKGGEDSPPMCGSAQSSPEFSQDTGTNVSLCNSQAFYKMFSPGKVSGPLCIKKNIKFLSSTATAGKEYEYVQSQFSNFRKAFQKPR